MYCLCLFWCIIILELLATDHCNKFVDSVRLTGWLTKDHISSLAPICHPLKPEALSVSKLCNNINFL